LRKIPPISFEALDQKAVKEEQRMRKTNKGKWINKEGILNREGQSWKIWDKISGERNKSLSCSSNRSDPYNEGGIKQILRYRDHLKEPSKDFQSIVKPNNNSLLHQSPSLRSYGSIQGLINTIKARDNSPQCDLKSESSDYQRMCASLDSKVSSMLGSPKGSLL